jgi:hypothetical protein
MKCIALCSYTTRDMLEVDLFDRARGLHIGLRRRHLFPHHLLRCSRLSLLVNAPGSWCEICAVQIGQILARCWVPVLGLPGCDADNLHGVNLLKRTAVGFADEEVNDSCAGETASGKDVAVTVVDG